MKTSLGGTFATDPLRTAQITGARDLAVEVVATHPDVVFVGHSLGGRLAQAAGATTGNTAVDFNSAPLGLEERQRGEIPGLDSPGQVFLFRTPDDPVSDLADTPGAIETVLSHMPRTGMGLVGNAATVAVAKLLERR